MRSYHGVHGAEPQDRDSFTARVELRRIGENGAYAFGTVPTIKGYQDVFFGVKVSRFLAQHGAYVGQEVTALIVPNTNEIKSQRVPWAALYVVDMH